MKASNPNRGPSPTTHKRKRTQNSRLPSAALYGTWKFNVLNFFFYLFILPILFYRAIVKLSVKFFRPDLRHMLRSHGSLFLRHSVHRDHKINVLVVFQVRPGSAVGKPPLTSEHARKLVLERWVNCRTGDGAEAELAYPELQMYVQRWAGYFFWKPESDFNVSEHFRFHRLDPGEDPQEFRYKYVREPFPEGRSPWEWVIVQRQRGDGEEVVEFLLKYHHVLADGYSIIKLLSHIVDPEKPMKFLSASKYLKESDGWLSSLKLPFRLVIEHFRFITLRSQLLPWPQFPAESFAAGKRHHFTSHGHSISLSQVKEIASKHGASVTAVSYAAIVGALRAYLLSKYDPESIPKVIRFPQAVPLLRKRPDDLRNLMCSVTFKLPVGEPDPLLRLRAVHRTIENRKKSTESLNTYLMLHVASILPTWFPFHFTPAAEGAACMSVTNFPGPLEEVAFYGLDIERMSLQSAAPPFPLYAGLFSYNGTLEWTISGDTRVFSQEDVTDIADAIGEEFKVLSSAAAAKDEFDVV